MPLQPLPADTRLLRFHFIVAALLVPCDPSATGGLKLTGEPDAAHGFFLRDKLAPGLQFSGDDYALLLDIETSTDRCLPLGLRLQTRAHPNAAWQNLWQGIFTCAEVAWDRDRCTASVSPVTDDRYRVLLENWDVPVDLLKYTGLRTTINARLSDLTLGGLQLEFRRIDESDRADYIGVDGWAEFYTNNTNITSFGGDIQCNDVVVFRYLRRRVYEVQNGTAFYWPDLSASGFNRLDATIDTSAGHPYAAHYAATPGIASFRASVLTGFGGSVALRYNGIYIYDHLGGGAVSGGTDDAALNAGGHFFTGNPARANTFLSCDYGTLPSAYGHDNADWLKITGPVGYGANNAECSANALNVRINVGDTNCRDVYWKFANFAFTRCLPLAEALRYLLHQTAAPTIGGVLQPVLPAIAALLPPTTGQLSTFYTATTNPATGDTAAANEIPSLYVSAASDVKRYGASEPATRLLISLKQFVEDACKLHDLGWFIDPTTGWFRIEHRSYAETQYGTGPVLDLPALPGAVLPRAYTTRQAVLPRFEELAITAANTVEGNQISLGVYETDFAKGTIDYGATACTNARADQNRATLTVSRLTGDVPALVLNGASLPDDALVVLTRSAGGQLLGANEAVSASSLLQRYHRYGRSAATATVNGQAVTMQSVKPQREQPNQSVGLCNLAGLPATVRLTTGLGPNGRIGKRELVLSTGVVTITAWLPIPVPAGPAQLPSGRQFTNSFEDSFW